MNNPTLYVPFAKMPTRREGYGSKPSPAPAPLPQPSGTASTSTTTANNTWYHRQTDYSTFEGEMGGAERVDDPYQRVTSARKVDEWLGNEIVPKLRTGRVMPDGWKGNNSELPLPPPPPPPPDRDRGDSVDYSSEDARQPHTVPMYRYPSAGQGRPKNYGNNNTNNWREPEFYEAAQQVPSRSSLFERKLSSAPSESALSQFAEPPMLADIADDSKVALASWLRKESWTESRRTQSKPWRARYAVLLKQQLHLFRGDEHDQRAYASMVITEDTMVRVSPNGIWILEIVCPAMQPEFQLWRLQFEEKQQMIDWLSAITKAIDRAKAQQAIAVRSVAERGREGSIRKQVARSASRRRREENDEADSVVRKYFDMRESREVSATDARSHRSQRSAGKGSGNEIYTLEDMQRSPALEAAYVKMLDSKRITTTSDGSNKRPVSLYDRMEEQNPPERMSMDSNIQKKKIGFAEVPSPKLGGGGLYSNKRAVASTPNLTNSESSFHEPVGRKSTDDGWRRTSVDERPKAASSATEIVRKTSMRDRDDRSEKKKSIFGFLQFSRNSKSSTTSGGGLSGGTGGGERVTGLVSEGTASASGSPIVSNAVPPTAMYVQNRGSVITQASAGRMRSSTMSSAKSPVLTESELEYDDPEEELQRLKTQMKEMKKEVKALEKQQAKMKAFRFR
ncbi:hypothetical protein BJ742DRAFT_769598 [Cladochytrium replicatum]|nr:hypothetical protein BJ742DRAFT_769598 [Cladochytrium replicatum]